MFLASPAPQEQKKVDPEEPKDQQLDKTTPEPPAPSSADKQSGGIPPEGPKESKKELKQDSKPKEVKSKAPSAAPKVPGNRGETRVSIWRCYTSLKYIKVPISIRSR
jgi:2-oxoglutarate dehydrogenase E2 component (dihydrolipoamide succinyltransferase)